MLSCCLNQYRIITTSAKVNIKGVLFSQIQCSVFTKGLKMWSSGNERAIKFQGDFIILGLYLEEGTDDHIGPLSNIMSQ